MRALPKHDLKPLAARLLAAPEKDRCAWEIITVFVAYAFGRLVEKDSPAPTNGEEANRE